MRERILGAIQLSIIFVAATLIGKVISALPAFAIRENISCTVCHSNGSAPHLTEAGYLYRRAGFRFPANIGNVELDANSMDILKHFVVGANVDYNVVTNRKSGQSSEALVSNNFDLREVELYPVVGAFFGNFATWSEVDFSPGTATTDSTTNTSNGSNLNSELSMADLIYGTFGVIKIYFIRCGPG